MTPVVRDLSSLVAFPTVSNRPISALAEFVAQRFEDMGFTIERFSDPIQEGKYNVVASIGPKDTPGLVLSGHMDVVPTEGQPWSRDPFQIHQENGRLYGRGTADMKGFIAATMQAAINLSPNDYERELICIWTYDEEIGCFGSHHLATQFEELGRRLPQACLIGEPTGFEMLRMHPGHSALDVQIVGKAAHSSRPDLGSNAIETAGKIIGALQEFSEILAGEHHMAEYLERPWVTLNTATISGGCAVNIVPDHCNLQVGFRPLPGHDVHVLTARITEYVRQRVSDSKTPFEIRLARSTPALLSPDGTPLQNTLCNHAVKPDAGAATFATDGGNLARLGCAPIIFGPGSIEVAHMADEYIPVDELMRAEGIIESVIRAHCC